MRWEDERYVRLYTRDTLTMLRIEWQGRAVLTELFRKVDRAGLLEIGDEDPVEALAMLLRMPAEVVAVGLTSLTSGKDPVVTIRDGKSRAIFIPNFLPAQEAIQSDRARKQKSRETARAREMVTPRDEESQGGTESHARSREVTPSLAVPSLADPKEPPAPSPAEQPAGSPLLIPEEPPVLAFPCDGNPPEWGLTQAQATEWAAAYPALDVVAEARQALQWVKAKPANRKTARGMPAFLVGWLGRAQNKNPARGGGPSPPQSSIRTTPGTAATNRLLAEADAKAEAVAAERRARAGQV